MKILILIASLFFNGCNNTPKKEPFSQDKRIEELIIGWKNDSLGCSNFRNKQVSEEIIKKLDLENCNESDFVKAFGVPNKTNLHNKNKILCYYFNSMCIGSQVVKDSDYCIVEFIFKEGKLIKRNYICI